MGDPAITSVNAERRGKEKRGEKRKKERRKERRNRTQDQYIWARPRAFSSQHPSLGPGQDGESGRDQADLRDTSLASTHLGPRACLTA